MDSNLNATFRERLGSGERLLGTFVKTAHPAVIEVLGSTGLDFLVLDAEHAPIGREQLDTCLLAARAACVPMLVRVPENSRTWIMTALDCGAAGIMAPHVDSVDTARHIVAAMRYGRGGRGFSPSVRAAFHGRRGIEEHLTKSAEETVLFCQIEDPDGAAAAQEIAALDGVDCLFVGPVDLCVAMEHLDPGAPEVVAACSRILSASRDETARTGIFLAGAGSIGQWQEAGGSVFVIGTDHAFLRHGAAAALSGT